MTTQKSEESSTAVSVDKIGDAPMMNIEQKVNAVQSMNKEQTELWAQDAIDSGYLPESITDPAQVLVIVQQGRELGLTPFIALNNLHVIKGRPVLSAAMLGALAQKRGVEWTIPEDYKKVLDKDGNLLDRVTTYEFSWKSKVTGKPVTTRHSVSWNQLTIAGYTSKQNYEKYPKEMLRARCLSSGIRALRPEILLGMYTDIEIADMHENEYDIVFDAEGQSTVIKKDE